MKRYSVWILAGVAALAVFLGGCRSKPFSSISEAEGASAGPFVVATYNIHVGKGVDGETDLGRIASVLTGAKADAAGLQEVDRFTQRTGSVDQLATLRFLTGMNGVFGKSIDFQGGEYGLGVLTKGEILESIQKLHPQGQESEQRSFQMAKIRLQSGLDFWLVNTHLGLNPEDRADQAATLLDAVEKLQGPVILVGDLNEIPDGTVTQALSSAFADAWTLAQETDFIPASNSDDATLEAGLGPTFRADDPKWRIDYIWLHPADAWVVHRAWVRSTPASDHLPLFAEVEYLPGK